MQPLLTDASLAVTGALPNGAGSTTTTSIDTGNTPFADNAMVMEYEIQAPALTTTMLPNGVTASYAVIMSNSANLSSPTVIYDNVVVQTGAGGAGAAAVNGTRFRLPFQPGGQNAALRYVGVRVTLAATAGNASTVSVTLLPRF